ncbi:hypothetical protein D3C74_141290 [compost metagenome]
MVDKPACEQCFRMLFFTFENGLDLSSVCPKGQKSVALLYDVAHSKAMYDGSMKEEIKRRIDEHILYKWM